MITSVTIKSVPFVLEKDRTSPANEQTVFHLRPKTVTGAIETAANYAKIRIQDRRNKRDQIDAAAMKLAEMSEFKSIVEKIERYAVTQGAPENAYDHFLVKKEKASDGYHDITLPDGTRAILIDEIVDDVDKQYVYLSMQPKDLDELTEASQDATKLKEGERNF